MLNPFNDKPSKAREQYLLELMAKDTGGAWAPPVRVRELAQHLGVCRRTIFNYLKKLRGSKQVQTVNRGRQGIQWRVLVAVPAFFFPSSAAAEPQRVAVAQSVQEVVPGPALHQAQVLSRSLTPLPVSPVASSCGPDLERALEYRERLERARVKRGKSPPKFGWGPWKRGLRKRMQDDPEEVRLWNDREDAQNIGISEQVPRKRAPKRRDEDPERESREAFEAEWERILAAQDRRRAEERERIEADQRERERLGIKGSLFDRHV